MAKHVQRKRKRKDYGGCDCYGGQRGGLTIHRTRIYGCGYGLGGGGKV